MNIEPTYRQTGKEQEEYWTRNKEFWMPKWKKPRFFQRRLINLL